LMEEVLEKFARRFRIGDNVRWNLRTYSRKLAIINIAFLTLANRL
jgi:hypothetical protein